MKAVLFLFLSAALLCSVAEAGRVRRSGSSSSGSSEAGPPDYCDLTDPDTAANNLYYLGTLAQEGEVWQHDVQVITPSTSAPPPAKDVQAYSFWQYNYANTARCAVSSIELSPRITATGQLAVAIQEIDAQLIPECRAKCPAIVDPLTTTSSSSSSPKKVKTDCQRSHPFVWFTGPTAESLFVQGKTPVNTQLGDNVQVTAWKDPVTGEVALIESLYTVIPGEHRLYSLSVPAQFVPGVPASTDFGALITFNSNSVVPPPFVAAALAAYQAGSVPIETDPNSPPGFPVPIYLYTVPTSKRDDIDFLGFEQNAAAYRAGTTRN